MSYYGYQQRVKADQKAVDYGVIQKDINTAFEGIQEEQSIKKEKRETDIASLRTEVSKELEAAREAARTNKGDDTFNAQVLQMANQSAQHMRALEQLLRAGKINPTDFSVQRQNLTDSVTQLKVVTSAYKESVNQALTRQEEGVAGGLEAMNMTEVQSIIDLKNHQLMIDPVSGMVRMHDDMNGTSEGIGDVQIRMMNKYDRYDLTDGLSKYAESVGAITIDENGKRTVNPAAKVAGLDLEDTVRTQWLEGLDVNQQASILSDNSGKDYKYFQADSEADVAAEANRLGINRDDLIWVKKNNGGRLESTLTDTQKDTASELAMKGLRTMIGYERTVDAPKAQTDTQRKAQKDTDKMVSYGDVLYRIFTEVDKTGASSAIASIIGDDFVEFTVSKDGKTGTLVIMEGTGKDRKKTTKPIEFGDSYEQFVKDYGGALLDIQDVAQYERELIGDRGAAVKGKGAGEPKGYKVERDADADAVALDTKITMDEALKPVDSELDSYDYWTENSRLSDFSTSAELMFEKLELPQEYYDITSDGDIVRIQFADLPPHDFDTKTSSHSGSHDQRRMAFLSLMKKIYKEATTGKAQAPTPTPPKPKDDATVGEEIIDMG